MQALLDVAIQKRGDALLQQIRDLAGATVVAPSRAELPEEYRSELDRSKELFEREGLVEGFWQLAVFPADYEENRIAALSRLQKVRRESAVSIRGWDFPHVDPEHDAVFEDGLESVTHWSRYHEAHRIYRSGLFSWRRRFAEDYTEHLTGSLSYVSTIYSFTEFFVFASRFASLVMESGDVYVQLLASGLHGRQLFSDASSAVIFPGEYSTAASEFRYPLRLALGELRASHLDLARDAVLLFLGLFGAEFASEAIEQWQRKFIERRF